MIKFPNTLAFRLTLRYALAFFSFIALGFLVLYFGIVSILNEEMEEDLEEDVTELAILYKNEGLESLKREIDREVKPGEEETIFIRLLSQDGSLLYSSDLARWPDLSIDNVAINKVLSGKNPIVSTAKFPGQEFETHMVYGAVGPDLVLNIGESFEEKHDLLEIIQEVLAVILVLAIPLASLISWFMAKQAVRGIERVSRTAEQIKLGKLDMRVDVDSRDLEIQNLASTFNAMLDRINALVNEMREITDNIAHDLRSPLTRIRAIAEVGVSNGRTMDEHRTAAAETIEECDRLMQMINASLDVAEVEAGISHNPILEVDVSELLTDACDLFQPVAEEKQIALKCNIDADCTIQGNIPNIQRMLANLIDNALKYTPEHGEITVTLTCNNNVISISVADSGVGIPEQEQQRVFERFYRCDQSRSQDGCGLGLSFSRAVARAHGGDIQLSSSPGRGSVFNVSLKII